LRVTKEIHPRFSVTGIRRVQTYNKLSKVFPWVGGKSVAGTPV